MNTLKQSLESNNNTKTISRNFLLLFLCVSSKNKILQFFLAFFFFSVLDRGRLYIFYIFFSFSFPTTSALAQFLSNIFGSIFVSFCRQHCIVYQKHKKILLFEAVLRGKMGISVVLFNKI